MRYAASRAGISHATWSRIERGRQSADNRLILAAVATALECSTADLGGMQLPVIDRDAVVVRAGVPAIRQALIELDLPCPTIRPLRPPPDLVRGAALVRQLWQRCDYAGAVRLLPGLIRDLHAAAARDGRALRQLCDMTGVASFIVRHDRAQSTRCTAMGVCNRERLTVHRNETAPVIGMPTTGARSHVVSAPNLSAYEPSTRH